MNEPTTSGRSPKRQRRHLAACAVLGALVAALTEPGQAADGAPGRVVSINLCTDQQAMAIAADICVYTNGNLTVEKIAR